MLDATQLNDLVDGLAKPFAGSDVPGASIAIFHRGDTLLSRACGLAVLEPRTPTTERTRYRLASLTKQFTATALLQLIEKREIGLETGVAELLPELAHSVSGVCIRHLLTHTSGLWDYEDLLPPDRTEQLSDEEVLALLSQASQRYFAPGARFRYSNSGYVLLALIVERITGNSFATYLREQIFLPLGMHSTLAYEAEHSLVSERAYGYSSTPDGFRLTDQSITSATLGDGGVYSCVADLALLEHVLTHGRMLSPGTLEQAWSPARLNDGTPIPYGFGWYVDGDRGRMRLTHHGETTGFTHAVVRYPREQLGIWVLTNRAGEAPWEIAQTVANGALALLEEAPLKPAPGQ